jgi:hypothetical protein
MMVGNINSNIFINLNYTIGEILDVDDIEQDVRYLLIDEIWNLN